MADTASESMVLVFCDIVLVIIFVIGVVANSLVLLVFYRKPGLRTISNRFVINLVATNLAACFVELPLVLVDNLLGPTEHVRTWLCAADEGVTAAVCSASVLAVLLIALDQYWAVVDPLRYHARIGSARSAGMILSAWIVALIFGISGGVDLAVTPKPSLWYSCGNSSKLLNLEESNLYPTLFAITFTTCIFVLPFAAILWIYICIYTAAHRNSQRTRRRGSSAIATNIDRQYFPIADAHNDTNKPSVRKNSINLQRSQTFAETDVRTRSVRKSSEGDLSFQPLRISTSSNNNDMLDPSRMVKQVCSIEIAEDSDGSIVSSFVAISVPNNKELAKEISRLLVTKESVSDDMDDYSTKPTAATFCLGAPEVNSKPSFTVSELTDNESQCSKSNVDITNVTHTFSKQMCVSEVTSIPAKSYSHDQEYSAIKPKNILAIDSKHTNTSLLATSQNGVFQGMSPIKSFSPLIKGMPHSNSMPTVTITPPQVIATRTSLSHNSSLRGSGNIVSSLRSRISNASLFRYREEMRAARISALVIIMALVNWLPYCALVLLYSNVLNISLDIPHYVNALGLLLLSSGALISPCLFAYRNRKLQREVKKVLGFSGSKREDGSSRREDTCRGDTNISVATKKKLKNCPLGKNRSTMEPARKFWDWRYWKQNSNQESRFIERNLLQHNVDSLREETSKDAGLLLSCMKGSRWVRQEGTCDLATLHNTALRTSVDTCRSSFSSGGSTNSTQCTSSSLETALD